MEMFALKKSILLSRVGAANAMKNTMGFQQGSELLRKKLTTLIRLQLLNVSGELIFYQGFKFQRSSVDIRFKTYRI
jgi:hypothetical protein